MKGAKLDEGRKAIVLRLAHLQAEDLVRSKISAPFRPAEAFLGEGCVSAEPLQHLQAAPRDAGRAAAFADIGVGLDHDARQSLPRQRKRSNEADRPAASDHHACRGVRHRMIVN